jgi:hypothetical protein
MSRDHRIPALVGMLAGALALVLAGPAGTAAAGTATVDSKWFPLRPGTEMVYDGTVVDADGSHHHRIVFTVTDLVKRVDGQLTVVGWDRDIQDGELQEAELALFAQNAQGDVSTLAEYPEEYENGQFAGAPSTWVSGLAGARGGILVPGHPRVGTPPFVQGRAPRIDFYDVGQVIRRGVHVCVPVGCFDHVTVVEEWSPLAPEDGKQVKYYAPGVGLVKIGALSGDSQETLTLTRVVRLGPDALEDAREQALRLDRHGHHVSAVWAKTPVAHRR